jgi:hypothetical protein
MDRKDGKLNMDKGRLLVLGWVLKSNGYVQKGRALEVRPLGYRIQSGGKHETVAAAEVCLFA